MLLLILTFIAFQFSAVQTWVAHRAANYLSNELKTKVVVEKVSINWPNDIQLGSLSILDERGDTLILTPQISIDASKLRLKEKIIKIRELSLNRPYVHIHKDSLGKSNIKFLIEYFTPEVKNPKKWQVEIQSLEVTEGIFKNTDDTRPDKREDIMDFANLHLNDIELKAHDVELMGSLAYFEVDHLSFGDKSGFRVNEFITQSKFDTTYVSFDNILIKTDYSEIGGTYAQEFESAWDYTDFNNLITQKLELENSQIGFQDINFFTPELEYFDSPIFVDGKFEGVLSDIKFRDVEFQAGHYTNFTGSGSIKGLPEKDKLFLDISSTDFRTHYSDLESIVLTPLNMQGRDLKVPNNLKELGHITMVADFRGTPKSFRTEGSFHSEVGNLSGDLNFSNFQDEGGVSYSGYVKSYDFDLGSILEVKDISSVNLEGKISGSGLTLNEIKTNLEVDVLDITYRDHVYSNIQINGDIEKNRFDGHAEINEPSLQALFDGKIDFQRREPVFDFKTYITHADLNGLNLINVDHESSLAGAISADFKGVDLDRIVGRASFTDLYYCKDEEMFDFGSGSVEFADNDTIRSIVVQTEMIDAYISGIYNTKELNEVFSHVLTQHLPSIQQVSSEETDFTDIDFDINLKDVDPITELFFPEYYLGPKTVLNGSLNTFTSQMEIVASSDSLQIGNNLISNFFMEGVQNNHQGYFVIEIESLQAGEFSFDDVWLTNSAYNDTIESDLTWSSDQYGGAGSITAYTYLSGTRRQRIEILPSELNIQGDYWAIPQSVIIDRDSTRIEIENLIIEDKNERIKLDGVFSLNPTDTIVLNVENFDLSRINAFFTDAVFDVGGIFTSELVLRDIYNDMVAEVNGKVTDFSLNQEDIGNLVISSNWISEQNLLKIDGGLMLRGQEQIDIRGNIFPFEESNSLNLSLLLNNFNLNVLNTIPSNAISNIGGKATGDIKVSGELTAPRLHGELLFDKAGVKIKYLNTRYTISDKVVVRPDYFGLDGIVLEDENGERANEVIATVFHNNFRDWNFDIAVFDFQNFKLLNTTSVQNPLYYGTAYGSGNLFLDGYDKNINITLEAKSGKGTQLNIPLGETGSGSDSFQNFITFVDKDTSKVEENQEIDLSGISLDMDLEITEDAEVQLIFDEKIGDVMRGRGNGNLKLEITPTADFNMVGRYEIAEGDYLFTLRNSLNKKFEVKPGGSISWYGDPYIATLDLKAIYNTRTSIYDLVIEDKEKWKKRVPVECAMNLSESLLNPEIDFEITFPSLNSGMAATLEDRVNSENELNKQVFGLLVLNQFFPPEDGLYNAATNVDWAAGAGSSTAEFLSTQLSNWLSNISSEFDIGFNYRPGDNITSEEVAVALSTQLFNDRLLLNGNFGVSYGQEYEQNTTSLIGDFILEYMIDQNGKFRLKVFNETNEFDLTDTNQSPATQGVGLLFQEDFDTFNDLMRKVRDLFRGKKETASR